MKTLGSQEIALKNFLSLYLKQNLAFSMHLTHIYDMNAIFKNH